MIKIASCELCGKYYRTGKIRQVIEKALGEGNKFKEWRKAVCNGCYDSIIKGEGVSYFNTLDTSAEIIEGDTLGAKVEKVYKASGEYKASKKLADAIVKPKKERKKRKNKITESEVYKSIAGGTGELAQDDEDVDTKAKEEPKKRGRKLKEKTTEPKKRGRKTKEIPIDTLQESSVGKVEAITEKVVSDFDKNFPTPEDIANATPAQPNPEVEDKEFTFKDINNVRDRAMYKEQVRQALASNPEILYSTIASKLGIDEGLVSQLADELEVGA